MKKAKRKVRGDYKKYLIESLRDPLESAAYINAALEEDEDPETLLLALRHVIEARNVSQLAKDTGLNRVTLYRILSKGGNPCLDSLAVILNAIGLKLKVEYKKAA